jgi:hypothetical protein
MAIDVKVVAISPTRAAEWIKQTHPHQRNLKKYKIPQYIGDMQNNNFPVTSDAIGFDVDGYLINGINRLTAIYRSGVTVEQLVVWGLPRKARIVVDSGAKRTTNDQLKMAGKDFPSGVGATVRALMIGLDKRPERGVSDYQVLTFLENYGDSIIVAHKLLPPGGISNAPIKAVVTRAHASKKATEKQLERFTHVLRTGLVENKAENAAVVLRNLCLQASKLSAGSGSIRAALYGYTEEAMRLFLAGRPTDKIEPAKQEYFPLPGETKWFSHLTSLMKE